MCICCAVGETNILLLPILPPKLYRDFLLQNNVSFYSTPSTRKGGWISGAMSSTVTLLHVFWRMFPNSLLARQLLGDGSQLCTETEDVGWTVTYWDEIVAYIPGDERDQSCGITESLETGLIVNWCLILMSPVVKEIDGSESILKSSTIFSPKLALSRGVKAPHTTLLWHEALIPGLSISLSLSVSPWCHTLHLNAKEDESHMLNLQWSICYCCMHYEPCLNCQPTV